jgi:hypothetical protein
MILSPLAGLEDDFYFAVHGLTPMATVFRRFAAALGLGIRL